MKYILLFIIFLATTITNTSFAEKNKDIISKLTYKIWRIKARQGVNTTSFGKILWDRPYKIFPIMPDTVKSVKYNIKALDCYTFVETTIAGQILGLSDKDYVNYNNNFKQIVNQIRFYGDSHEYGDQLHYASDWLHHLQELRLADNITQRLGGIRYNKKVNFMTSHTHLYKFLKDNPEQIRKVQIRENKINKRIRYYIPTLKFPTITKKLKEGDIILFTTPTKGLDVGHMGFVTIKNNIPYLLEASKVYQKVTIDPLPIENYLAEHIRRFNGVIVGRLTLNSLKRPK